jgi:flavodoxin
MRGMKENGVSQIALKKVGEANESDFKDSDTWIFGSPVHIGGATGDAKKALNKAIETGARGKKGTAFDTRFTGYSGKGAAEKMMEKMEEAGVLKAVEPQPFAVLKTKGPLAEGEEAKAIAFGKKIAEALRT